MLTVEWLKVVYDLNIILTTKQSKTHIAQYVCFLQIEANSYLKKII